MNIRSLISIIFLIIFGLNVSAQYTSMDKKANREIPLDDKVRYGKLENGFTYYLRDNDSETTEFRLVVRAGLYHEEKNELDYAHLMEHMVFKYPRNFPFETDFFGTAGRYHYARTTYFDTFYYAQIPSLDKEGKINAFQLLRDHARLENFDSRAIDVERGAIIGEGRYRDIHATWINDTLEHLVLQNTNLDLTSRAEYKSSMMNFDREAFIKFHDDWYRPDIQAAIIVGNIDVDSAESNIKSLFADLKMPKNPKNAREKVEDKRIELPGTNQFFRIKDTLKPYTRMYIVSKNINREFLKRSKNDYKEMLMQRIYDDIIHARSIMLIRQYEPPYHSFTPDYAASTVGAGQVFASMMQVNFKNGSHHDFYTTFQKALLAWKQIHTDIKNSEINDAKNRIKASYSMQDLKASQSLVMKYSDHFVLGSTAMDPSEELSLIHDLLDEISQSDIQKFTSEFGNLARNTDFILFTGDTSSIPSKTSIKMQLKETNRLKVESPLLNAANISSLQDLVMLPEQNVIENANTSENLIGITTLELSNGIKIILKPTKPRQEMFENRVSIRAIRRNLLPFSERENYITGSLVPDAIQFLGVGPYTKFDLDKFKQDNSIEFNWDMTKDFQIMEGTSNVEDVEELLNIFYLYVAKPRKNKKDFSYWKEYKKFQLQNRPKSSGNFYMDEIEYSWYPKIPRLKSVDIDKLSSEEIFDSHEKWFSDFNNVTFIITGDFDSDQMRSVLSNKLSVFPADKSPGITRDSKHTFPYQKMDTIIRMKQINQSFGKLYFPIIVPKNVKTMSELNFLVKALHRRIFERLRLGAYSPVANGEWLDQEERIFAFSVSFDSELDNYENMVNAAIEEFKILKEKGVEKEWLEREIMNEKVRFSNRIESFGYFNFWPDYIQEMEKTGEDPEEIILKYEAFIEHFLRVEDINQAAKLYMNMDNIQKFIVLPEGFEEDKNLNK